MLALNGNPKIFFCKEVIDLRKGFEGLSQLVDIFYPKTLTTGAYFVFLNRTKDRMKVLYWDNDGLAIWQKRLEQGRFVKRKNQGQMMERREFLMMLEGVVPKRVYKRFKI